MGDLKNTGRRERLESPCTKPECAEVGGFFWILKQGLEKDGGLFGTTAVGTVSWRH